MENPPFERQRREIEHMRQKHLRESLDGRRILRQQGLGQQTSGGFEQGASDGSRS